MSCSSAAGHDRKLDLDWTRTRGPGSARGPGPGPGSILAHFMGCCHQLKWAACPTLGPMESEPILWAPVTNKVGPVVTEGPVNDGRVNEGRADQVDIKSCSPRH
jgi:hypothetical protein